MILWQTFVSLFIAIFGVCFGVYQYLERRKYESIDWLADIDEKDLLIKEFERSIDAFKREESQKCANKILAYRHELAKKGFEESGAWFSCQKGCEEERDKNILKMVAETNAKTSKLNIEIAALKTKLALQPKWQKRLDRIFFKSKVHNPTKKHIGV